MLLIYTHKITPRFSYIMKQVFTRILGIETTSTTKVEDFIKHSGPKITYTKQALQNEFFIRSSNMLFEQGISNIDVSLGNWEDLPCFFSSGERSSIPFDIFAASFYLLSRYEEYLPHVKDVHGRFPPKDSIAYQHGFLRQPIVDQWAFKLLEKLQERFPELERRHKPYNFTTIIDVSTSHCFANRDLVRSFAGLLLDLGSLKFKRVSRRVKVWFNLEKDPYDNFEYLIELIKKLKVRSMFFFQFASYSTYDKNVSPNNNRFKFLIKSIADYSTVSLAASYSSFNDLALLKKEKKRLELVVNRAVNFSRMRYNRVDVPETYRNLVESEFTDDYTMGYTHEIGFRAGTCIPFYFYDINLEVQQPIRVHSFAVHDYALRNLTSKDEILDKVNALYKAVKSVSGDFNIIFSNELLGGENHENWIKLYETMLKKYND